MIERQRHISCPWKLEGSTLSWSSRMNANLSSISIVFGGDTPEFPLTACQIAARAFVVYVGGVLIVRLGKSRLISRATPLDVILGFILGSLLSRGITGHAALTDTIFASAVLVAIHWSFTAFACRCSIFDNLIKGNAYPLVERGQQQAENMLRSHVSGADLVEAMHLHGIEELSEVKAAYKERNGEISVIQSK
jgi:uncharacterized membrane protein YcaP (DUF421 family)